MKVVLHQIRHHLSLLWWKILLLYGLEFTFLNFSDNFHCVYQEIHDYPKETDMSFLMLLFFCSSCFAYRFSTIVHLVSSSISYRSSPTLS